MPRTLPALLMHSRWTPTGNTKHDRVTDLQGTKLAVKAEVAQALQRMLLASQRRDRALAHAQAVAFRAPPRAILATLPSDGSPAAARCAPPD